MARVNNNYYWATQTGGATWARKFLRGGATRLDVDCNSMTGPVTFTMQEAMMIPNRFMRDTLAFSPNFFFPIFEAAGGTTVHNYASGTAGAATGSSAAIVASNGPADNEGDTQYNAIANGFFTVLLGGVFSSYNGPFTIEIFFYPTLLTGAIIPLWSEVDAGGHFFQCYVTNTGQIGMRGAGTAGANYNVIAGGPTVTLNQWNFVQWAYTSPNLVVSSFTMSGAFSASTPININAGAGVCIFPGATATSAGIISGANGFVTGVSAFNLPAQMPAIVTQERVITMGTSYAVTALDSATLAASGRQRYSYGEGTPNALPAVVLATLAPGASNSWGQLSTRMSSPD